MKSDIRLILHGTRQLLVYASDVHTPGGNIHATNKNTEVDKTPTHALFIQHYTSPACRFHQKYIKIFNGTPTCFDLKRSSSVNIFVPC